MRAAVACDAGHDDGAGSVLTRVCIVEEGGGMVEDTRVIPEEKW